MKEINILGPLIAFKWTCIMYKCSPKMESWILDEVSQTFSYTNAPQLILLGLFLKSMRYLLRNYRFVFN